MEPLKVPKKVNRHILKALDFLQASRTDYVSVEAIQDRVKWTLRKTKPVENLEYVVMEALNNQTELGILSRSGSMYAMALGLPSLHSKKVNRHVLKALNYLQTSKTDFVSIEAIQDRVKQSLRYTKPVSNLEELVRDCLRNQTELGIVSRSGSSKYAMTLLFQGPRSMKNEDYTEKNRAYERCTDSLTVDEVAKVRNILCNAQKPIIKRKPGAIWPKHMRKTKSSRNIHVKTEKSPDNGPSIICDNCFVWDTWTHGLNKEEKFNKPNQKFNRNL